jgi:transcriptional regulator with XRE-family HTH domain
VQEAASRSSKRQRHGIGKDVTRPRHRPGEASIVENSASSASFDISKQLRDLRRTRGRSLEEVARKAGLTKGFLSLIERGLKAPSISSLQRLSHAYGVSIGALLDGSSPSEPKYSLVRRDQRRKYAREGSLYGYRYEALAFHKQRKRMEPFIVSPPVRIPKKFFSHDGDEMVFVLQGQVELQLDTEVILLLPGDCIYFEASIPHRSRSVGNERASTLVAVSEG